MKLQSAFSKALLKGLFECLRLHLTYAMAESVVSEPFKGNVRMIPEHPPVERVMKKQVTQQGCNYKALRRTSFSEFEGTIFQLNGGFEPPLNIEQHPRTVGTLSHRT